MLSPPASVRSSLPTLIPLGGLQRVADLLQSRRGIDRLDVDQWIADHLDGLGAAPHHLVIPKFAWPAIYTTNYDRLVEKGYDAQTAKAQRLQVVRNAYEEYDITDASVVSLFKINGCISRLQDPKAPLVLSKEDLRRTQEGRRIMLKRLADLQRSHSWLFVGYSFRDDVIVDLLYEIRELLGEPLMRWSYALLPRVDDYERDYLLQYRVSAIACDAASFFRRLDQRKNQFSAPPAIATGTTPAITKVVKGTPFELVDSQFELVGLTPFGAASPSSFYRGNTPTWADLEARFDVRRDQADELERMARELLERIQNPFESRSSAIILTGTAGTGKSTILRRLAYDLYSSLNITLLVAREGVQWDARHLSKVAKAAERPIVVLIDSGETDYQRLRSFYRTLADRDVPALVLIGARIGAWSVAQRHWGPLAAADTIEINERLSRDEVRSLLDKLAAHGFVEVNAVTDEHYWLARAAAADRLALVVLLELVQDGRFEEIVLSEYQGLKDDLSEEAYRTVSVIHEFGIPVKRELLRRVLGCDWGQFIQRVLQGAASKVVIEDYETVTGQAFYRTKHPLIAKIIREHTVNTPLDSLQRLVANIDVADRADAAMVRSVLKSDHLSDMLKEHGEQRQLFAAAVEALPEDVVIRHQMGINEMENGHLEDARRIFETCLDLSHDNTAVTHSFGLLERERARRVEAGPLKELLYQKALKYFQRVIDLDRHSEYGYHSAAALFLNRAMHEDIPAHQKMIYAANALEMVDIGLAETDKQEAGRLVDIKGQILELLDQLGAARDEYEQSIAKGTATAFTYYLLARLEVEGGNEEHARFLIKQGLAWFEEDSRLLAIRAELSLSHPIGRGELVEVLGPAVRANPKRLSLRFPYAVALYELGNMKEAYKHFRRMRSLSEGVFGKSRVRKLFTGKNGIPIVFEGILERTSPSGGFLRAVRSDNRDAVYFSIERALASGLKTGSSVSFEIGFSYLGPIALNLKARH